jgi:hypothetical protein
MRSGSGIFSIVEVQIEQQVFSLKKINIAKLLLSKTIRNGLGKMSCAQSSGNPEAGCTR